MFKAGDIVICVDDSVPDIRIYRDFDHWVHKGHEYTIRRYEKGIEGHNRVLLEGIHNKPVFVTTIMGHIEPGFAEYRFKKKQELTADEIHAIREEALEEV